ncbi:MAG: hypothetical protein VKK80_17025 [Prochlorothrix sp.]|jgi:hypothetical protein|nr:hypothetical protein [Prochlorothrix sp.]
MTLSTLQISDRLYDLFQALPPDLQHHFLKTLIQHHRPTIEALCTESDTPTKAEILGDLQQAWHEARTGQTIPLSQLWDGIEDA